MASLMADFPNKNQHNSLTSYSKKVDGLGVKVIKLGDTNNSVSMSFNENRPSVSQHDSLRDKNKTTSLHYKQVPSVPNSEMNQQMQMTDQFHMRGHDTPYEMTERQDQDQMSLLTHEVAVRGYLSQDKEIVLTEGGGNAESVE